MQHVTLSFGEKEFPSIKKLLEEIYPEKTPLEAKCKKALKTILQETRQAKKIKKNPSNTTSIESILSKKYLTSKNNFLPVRKMDRNHIFNAVRKMEREARFTKNPETGRYHKDPDEAYPSLPNFAGYADLVRTLKWFSENQEESQ